MAAKPAAPAVDTMVNMAMPIASYPLIARQALFGNPVKSAGRLSPDGKWVSYLAPRDGVMNIWVAPADLTGLPNSAWRAINGAADLSLVATGAIVWPAWGSALSAIAGFPPRVSAPRLSVASAAARKAVNFMTGVLLY